MHGGQSWVLKIFAASTLPPCIGFMSFAPLCDRKIGSSVRFFKSWSGWQKLIVYLVDSDHGWNGSVIRVSVPWEATSKN